MIFYFDKNPEEIEEIHQQEPSIQIEVENEEDEFQYYYVLKNRKLFSETTVQDYFEATNRTE
jgi:hypothetical protein